MKLYGKLPGPAGEEGEVDLSAPVGRAKLHGNRFQVAHRVEEHLAKGDVLQVLGVTRGIAGEISLLLNRQGRGTVRASMTRAAVQKVGPRPGDVILLEKDVRPIVSSHYNPMQLICLGSDVCIRVGAIKDEEACEDAEDTEGGRGPGGHDGEMLHASCRQPVGQRCEGIGPELDGMLKTNPAYGGTRRPEAVKPVACLRQDPRSALCTSPLDNGERIGDRIEVQGELDTILCQETQTVCPRLAVTVTSAGEQVESRPASTWHSRPEASMNADLYLAFTESDSEGEAVAGGHAGPPSSHREEPVAPVEEARQTAQTKFSAPVALASGFHCIHPPPLAPVAGVPGPPATAIDNQADKDEEDDLLAGLDDPF